MTTDYRLDQYKRFADHIEQNGGYDHIIANANLKVTVHNDAYYLFREITYPSFFYTDISFQLREASDELRTALMGLPTTGYAHRHESTTVNAMVYRAEGRLRILVPPQFGWNTALAVTADYGCSHSMKRTNLGRCYNRYDCDKCDYSYTVDSGD